MKEKIAALDFKYKIRTYSFFFFLIISVLSPLSGTDWNSYLIGKEGIVNCFQNIELNNGRIISSIIVNFFSYNKILFDIFFAIAMSSFIKNCNDLMGTVKNKYYYLLPFIGTLLVSVPLISNNYISVYSTITYTFPAILAFSYFCLLIKSESKVTDIIKESIMAIFIMLSNINIAIAFILGNIIYLILSKNKKIFILLIEQLICLIISISLLKEPMIYTNTNEIFSNIYNYIELIFSKNILLIIIGAIPINYYLAEKLKSSTYSRVLITLFDSFLVFSLMYNFFHYSPVNLNLVISKYNGVFATENWYYIFYFISYIILFAISINHYIKNKRIKILFNSLMTISFITSILILVSPLFKEESIILIVLTIICITSNLLKEIECKMDPKILKILLTLLVIYYIGTFGVIKYIDIKRDEYIKEQIEEKCTNIEIKASPFYLVGGYNPTDINQEQVFKDFYKIPSENTIEVKYFGVFEKIEKNVKN